MKDAPGKSLTKLVRKGFKNFTAAIGVIQAYNPASGKANVTILGAPGDSYRGVKVNQGLKSIIAVGQQCMILASEEHDNTAIYIIGLFKN